MAVPMYKVEYARSGRSGCKAGKKFHPTGSDPKIEMGELRISRRVHNAAADTMFDNWHHFDCFWSKGGYKLVDVSDLEGFTTITPEDQQRIRDELAKKGGGGGAPAAAGSGKAKAKSKTAVPVPRPLGCPELQMEYAKSSRSKCRMCFEQISSGELRVASLRPSETEGRAFQGDVPHWCHRKCFVELLKTDDYSDIPLQSLVAEMFDGFQDIQKADLKDFTALLNVARQTAGLDKVAAPTAPKEASKEDKERDAAFAAQQKEYWDVRRELETYGEYVCEDAARNNGLHLSKRPNSNDIFKACTDGVFYGVLKPCQTCNSTQWDEKADGYHCTGFVDGDSPCFVVTQTPSVKKFTLSAELKKSKILKQAAKAPVPRVFLKQLVKRSLVAEAAAAAAPKPNKRPADDGAAASSSSGPLDGIVIATAGKLTRSVKEMKELVTNLGGTYHTAATLGSFVHVLVSNLAEVNKGGKKVVSARKFGVPIVTEAFLTNAEKSQSCPLIEPHVIECSSTIVEPSTERDRVDNHRATKLAKSDGKIGGTKAVIVKGRGTVDPNARCDMNPSVDIQAHYHVYDHGGTLWSAQTTNVNLRENKNSYYKLQILERDPGVSAGVAPTKFYYFKSWGRVGVPGASSCESMYSVESAKSQFQSKFSDLTGNSWQDRDNFEKKKAKYTYIPDAGASEEADMDVDEGKISESKLKPQVRRLMELLSDKTAMAETMKELEIDMSKMPLGRLSESTLKSAHVVLKDIETILSANEGGEFSEKDQNSILSLTTKFYSLVPQSFGMRTPPPIATLKTVGEKVELVESLLQMEYTGRLIKSAADNAEAGTHPIDAFYDGLNTKLSPLKKGSAEFAMLETYIQNTHGGTHKHYTLTIREAFKVKRHGETDRYKPFSGFHNRRLLWHGSRLTNWPGILTQGLRIAPPEAPVTGYMFGKGVYFADAVSKSANYCCTSSSNPTGLMALSEVALGTMHEIKHSDSQLPKTLPKGKHATFGIGRQMPKKSDFETLDNGTIVPLGKIGPSGVKDTSLEYNEFIVYNTDQVNIKYLLQLDFNFRGRW